MVSPEETHESAPLPCLPPTPRTPPTLEELSRTGSQPNFSGHERSESFKIEPFSQRSTWDRTTPSAPDAAPSRTDTNRSSISGKARGMIRHVPDMRMFHATKTETDRDKRKGSSKERSKTKDERHAHFNSRAEVPKAQLLASTPNSANLPASNTDSPSKKTIKDRRHLAHTEAIKLTLPLNIPELPPRQRTPGDGSMILSSRPRSPKTPWIHGKTPYFQTPEPGLRSTPVLEEYEPRFLKKKVSDTPIQSPAVDKTWSRIPRNRLFGRVRWGHAAKTMRSSEGSPGSEDSKNSSNGSRNRLPIDQKHQAQQETKEPDASSRQNRFRWGDPISSKDLKATPPSDSPPSIFSISRILKPKRSVQKVQMPSSLAKGEKAYWHQKQPMTEPDLDVIDNLPVPPSFIPPGLNRIPTPPMLDSNGEVQGKLADFHFDLQGVRTHKPHHSQGGVWDSDTLLMPQNTDIQLSVPSSEESREDPIPKVPSTPGNPPYSAPITSAMGIYTPPYQFANNDFFRVNVDIMSPNDAAARGAEEITKLEWLTPEHLPSSPLCPLHEKYRGPSTGLCVYHGKKLSLSSEGNRRRRSGPKAEAESAPASPQRRGLARKESSRIDGSEDAGEGSVASVSTRLRKRRWWFRVDSP